MAFINDIEQGLGINNTAGNAELQQALAALQAVGVPTAAQLDLPTLQKYVQAGVLSPAQYQAISADPQAFQQLANQADMSGQTAQKQALQELGGVVQASGSTPINQANLVNNINTTNQAMQAARQGIQENAQERGVAGGGQEFLSQLLNEQGNAQTANMNAVNAASNNAQLALQAMTNQGQLGGQIQSQSSADALAKAQAAQQINEYNSQLQSAANQYNTQNANTAQATNLTNAQNISNQNTGLKNYQTQYNAQVPQTVYSDQMQKAQGLANAYGNEANLQEQQAQGSNQFIGSLLGAGATLGGDYLIGQGTGGFAKGAPVSGAEAINSGYGSTPTGSNANPNNYGINQNPVYAHGGEVDVTDPQTGLHASAQPIQVAGMAFGGETNPKKETLKAMENNPTAGFNQGGMCYAKGGEVHSHEICMKMGGKVPGTPKMSGDHTANDTVPARLSPHEIVVPNSVTQRPDAPQAAAKFVAGIKGQPQPQMGNGKSFSDIIKELEANGLELRLGAK